MSPWVFWGLIVFWGAILPCSAQMAFIPNPDCYFGAIQVFENGNGVFSAQSRQVPKFTRIERFIVGKKNVDLLYELGNCSLAEQKFRIDLNQLSLTEQELDNRHDLIYRNRQHPNDAKQKITTATK